MDRRTRSAFLLLVLAQAAHSVEEYVTRLYETFAPARAVSVLVSDDPATGFVVVNASLVAFGLWYWWRSTRGLAWAWSVLALANGSGHVLLALVRGGYFPGVVTAPLLVLAAGRLAVLLVGSTPRDATFANAAHPR